MTSTRPTSDLSNWNPFKVQSMFPKLKLNEPQLAQLKDNYLKEENWNSFESFYHFLQYQEKQTNQAVSSIDSRS